MLNLHNYLLVNAIHSSPPTQNWLKLKLFSELCDGFASRMKTVETKKVNSGLWLRRHIDICRAIRTKYWLETLASEWNEKTFENEDSLKAELVNFVKINLFFIIISCHDRWALINYHGFDCFSLLVYHTSLHIYDS